jgi:hypothetical protein
LVTRAIGIHSEFADLIARRCKFRRGHLRVALRLLQILLGDRVMIVKIARTS